MKKILVAIAFLLIFACLPVSVQAATLYSSLRLDSYNNETFILDVYVANPNESINAVSGTISFPSDKLEVSSTIKDDSIFDIWAVEPIFSNNLGTIDFAGIILDAESVNETGKIMSIVFKEKSTGIAEICFSSGAVLANNGEGTNILKDLDSTTLLLK